MNFIIFMEMEARVAKKAEQERALRAARQQEQPPFGAIYIDPDEP